ncbi:hypothetical protein BJ170DRAFT_572995 [Xylariales sp. AK1849]|nr:hypothetical protein BJ170DRAFT_572995 [Xylariales sp. AK1849]
MPQAGSLGGQLDGAKSLEGVVTEAGSSVDVVTAEAEAEASATWTIPVESTAPAATGFSAQQPEADNLANDDPRPPLAPGQCYPELDFLRHAHSKKHFSNKVRYLRRCIQPVFSADVDRNDVANVSEPLIADDLEITVDFEAQDCSDVKLPKCIPIKLQVPRPYSSAANYSHLIFGVSTDYDRLSSSIPSFAHWFAGTGSRLVALVTDMNAHTNSGIHKLQQKFRNAGVDVSLVRPLDESYTTSQSHFTVLVHMLNHSSPATQWYGLLDDDTFFPHLEPLSDALATLDHEKDQYVGALSEDFMAVRNFGFMAFGGAGAYLSAPLARTLGAQAVQCIDQATAGEGDIIIRDCVYRNSKAKLTILPGLYQQDLKDDASGFFESGVQAINFHHWKSWYKEPVVKMSSAATYCGGCFLQRWRFGTDTVFSNGFSVVQYRYGVEHLDLGTMEGTWVNANKDFDFSIGPLRRKLVPDEKKSYKLVDVDANESGDLKQLYVWKGNAESNEMDNIIELVWEN